MKRKFAILLVLVLALSACSFSLAACDEEGKTNEISDFERFNGWRYLTEYTYSYTSLFEWDEEHEKWDAMYTWWDEDSMYESTDDLKGYDYLINYNDGDFPNEKWNALFLQGKSWMKSFGETLTLSREELEFSGTLGSMPIKSMEFIGFMNADIELSPSEEQMAEADLHYYSFETKYFAGTSHEQVPPVVQLIFVTKGIEIDGQLYCAQFEYSAPANVKSPD